MNIASVWRIGLVLVGVLVLTGLLSVGRWHGPDIETSTNTANTVLSNASCRKCHSEVWNEWENSYHSQAFTHADVQAAFRHFGHDRQCESCHASEPVLPDLTQPIVLRGSDRESGVNCLTCHQLPNGSVAARRTIEGVPCHPTETPALLTSEHCAGCHKSVHKDWLASPQKADGKTCQSCHMPTVASRLEGRSHLFVGGHDDNYVRSAVTMKTQIDETGLIVSITNAAAGHNFPGEKHNRVLLVEVIERTSDGEITLAEQKTIKAITPFRGESTDEKIRAGQSFDATFPIVSPANKAEVRLIYKRFPWYPDHKALVVQQLDVNLL